MKKIIEYISEALSEQNKKLLDSWIEDNVIDDDIVNNIRNYLSKKTVKNYQGEFEKYNDLIRKIKISKPTLRISKDSRLSNYINGINELIVNINNDSALTKKSKVMLYNDIKERINTEYTDNDIYKGEHVLLPYITDITNDNIVSKYNNLANTEYSNDKEDNKDSKVYEFIVNKGLSSKHINWGNRHNVVDEICDIFKDLPEEEFNDIIDNNGKIDWATFFNNGHDNSEIHNIFNEYCKEFSDEANVLSTLTDVKAHNTTANVGPFEVLLKIIIKEATSGNKGDVTLKDGSGMEVKLAGSGGARLNGQHTETSTVLYKTINTALKKMGKNVTIPAAAVYFNDTRTKTQSINILNHIIKQLDNFNGEKLINAICKGIYTQHGIDINDKSSEKSIIAKSFINKISQQKNVNKVLDNTTVLPGIYDFMGALHVSAYQIEENWQYICFVNEDGTYIVLTDTDAQNPEYILSKLYFGPLGATDSSTREKTGRPFIKKSI